ncbi:hypothetical protein Goarm_003839 [Gossypium armourianum]|uniref:Uncharacterized protein n=1 Tax=Gossypium armourianum TaxID=34283 RepID=A0A7J9K4J1_9ROSI|nr:hypothetical protein [Gossypium armourianum]
MEDRKKFFHLGPWIFDKSLFVMTKYSDGLSMAEYDLLRDLLVRFWQLTEETVKGDGESIFGSELEWIFQSICRQSREDKPTVSRGIEVLNARQVRSKADFGTNSLFASRLKTKEDLKCPALVMKRWRLSDRHGTLKLEMPVAWESLNSSGLKENDLR